MTISNKKCKGCGAYLTLKKNEVGYVPKIDKNTNLCYRCFRLKNYNENIEYDNIKDKINQTIDQLVLSDKYCFLIVDILDLYGSLIRLNQQPKKLFLVVNKTDLINQKNNLVKTFDAIKQNLKLLNYQYDEIIFCSANTKSSIKTLNDKIKQLPKNAKCIFIGRSNVGKSSIIKSLLKLNHLQDNLTINNAINTTINLQKIKLGYHFLIDTPGVVDKTNLITWVDQSKIKKIFNNKIINARNFQIKYNKRIIIENLVTIDLFVNNDDAIGSCTFYMNKNLYIVSKQINDKLFNQSQKLGYIHEDINQIKQHEFILNNAKSNISISGLGLIAIKNINKCVIYVHDEVAINQLPIPIL